MSSKLPALAANLSALLFNGFQINKSTTVNKLMMLLMIYLHY